MSPYYRLRFIDMNCQCAADQETSGCLRKYIAFGGLLYMANSSGSRNRNYSSVSSSTRRSYNGRSRRRRNNNPAPLIAGGILVLVLALILVFITLNKNKDNNDGMHDPNTETTALVENISKEEIEHNAVIDLSQITGKDTRLSVQGMTPAEISKAVSDAYDWSLAITNEDAKVGNVVKPTADANQTTEAATMGDAENPDAAPTGEQETAPQEITVTDKIEIPDYIAARIPDLIEEIVNADEEYKESIAAETSEEETTKKKKGLFNRETEPETSETETETEVPAVVYTLSADGLEDQVSKMASYAEQMWYVEPLGGSIGSYDASNDKFVMEGARNGFRVNEDELRQKLLEKVRANDYTGSVAVTGEVLSGEAKTNASEYKIIGSYTTNTTSNPVRNKNIQLAAQKLNGTIVRPGEEFSFNNTIGERTEEKGFGAAAAYNNGEVVQEVGGGVCQVSTTLYNAVVRAGLKVTYRQGHTFQPTYVTPGQDATISWGGPDFRFANLPAIPAYSNDNHYAIGIKASYYNQQVTVQIYGRPVLKSGYSYALESEKTKEVDIVRKLIEPGSDKTPTTGTKGSVWETKLIVKNGDQVVSNSKDHTTIYTGHIEYYTDETTPAPTESSEVPSDGEITDQPGENTESDAPDVPLGPGGPGAGPGQNTGSTDHTGSDSTSSADGPGGGTSATVHEDNDEPVISPGSSDNSAPVSSDNTPSDGPGFTPVDAGSPDNSSVSDGPGGGSSGSGGGIVVEGGPGSVDLGGDIPVGGGPG